MDDCYDKLKFKNLRIPVGVQTQRRPWKFASSLFPVDGSVNINAGKWKVSDGAYLRIKYDFNNHLAIKNELSGVILTQVYFTPVVVNGEDSGINQSSSYVNNIKMSKSIVEVSGGKYVQLLFPPIWVRDLASEEVEKSIINVASGSYKQLLYPPIHHTGTPESITKSIIVVSDGRLELISP